jgi:hypothetical protein
MSTVLSLAALATMQLFGCASPPKHDIAHYPYPKAQAELRDVLDGIIHDAETANVQGLRDSHLNSDKFTKFGGTFERINVDQCNEGEIAGVTSVQDLKFEMKDRKIDVFGDVAIMTCYNHFSHKGDGELRRSVARNTLVFLKTADGWKIVHEHVTPKACFEQGAVE